MFKHWLALFAAALMLLSPQPGPALANAESAHTTVVFVGGYGSTLATAARDFGSLRSALVAQDASTTFAQYSYVGWNAQRCVPLEYRDTDTGQDFETSKRRLIDMLSALHTQCGAQRIVVIGHSLGGLVAFHALADSPMPEVTDLVTVDSPLGGAPSEEIQLCIESGLCVDGPVSGVLSGLYAAWSQTALDNSVRVGRLAQAGTRVTAWGNQRDCLYAPGVCLPFARNVLGAYNVGDTQWLGVDRAMRRDYASRSTLAGLLNSHQVVLSSAAPDIAVDLLA